MKSLLHKGCPLAYKTSGKGAPVVFIQGVGLHGDGWKPQVDELAAKYTCLSFDNRGMGRSQPMGAPITVEQMAEDTLALMDSLGWQSAHIAGHSLGGLVAQHLGLTARSRVRSLSLLCTVARGADATSLSPWMLAVGLRTRIGPRRARRMAFLQIVMPPEVLATADRDALAAELEASFGHDLADQPPVVMKQLSALRAYDATNRLRELSGIPTLVVSAKHDHIAPPDRGRALADGIPGSRFV
ncbi:MAG: alpha/beta fold hydrolase, partial [Bryobacteraceae bacterium]